MRAISSIAGSGTIVVPVDYYQMPFNAGVYVNLTGSASATYTVQISPDNPYSSWATDYATNAAWYNINTSTNFNSTSAAQYTTINTPCQGIKLTVSGTATTSSVLYVLQGQQV